MEPQQVWQVGLLDLDIYGPSLPELVRWEAEVDMAMALKPTEKTYHILSHFFGFK